MRARILFPTLAAAVLLQLLNAGFLAAQDHRTTPPARFIPASLVAASALAPAAPPPLTPELVLDPRKQLRRGRALIAVGSGLIVAGVVHAALFGRRATFSEPEERMIVPPLTGSIVAAAGLGMTFGGGSKIARVPADIRRANPLSAKGKAGVILGAIGAAAVTSALLVVIVAPQMVECVSS